MSAPNGQEFAGVLIATARRALKQAVLRQARPLRVTPAQFWFLNAVREFPGGSLGDIVRRQRFAAPTRSRPAEGLAPRRLGPVQPAPRDRRAVRVALTPAGARLAEKIAPIVVSV